jgi:DNA recombination protein RmuC
MGFRTMALQQRSAEVWEVLGAVKTEFDKFGPCAGRVKSQTQTVLESIDKAQTRTRQMTKALKGWRRCPRRMRSSCCWGRRTKT